MTRLATEDEIVIVHNGKFLEMQPDFIAALRRSRTKVYPPGVEFIRACDGVVLAHMPMPIADYRKKCLEEQIAKNAGDGGRDA